jgi:predicted ABC-type ATPase
MPSVIVIGGPNGAGKTTVATRLLPALGIRHFVNADDIARGLSAFAPESVAIEAGRFMLHRIDELVSRGESFAFESTLAARSFAVLLRGLARSGYRVHVVYLWLLDPDLAVSRVAERVRRGGHAIQEDVVRRRYRTGLANFFGLYQQVATSWVLYDNSEGVRVRIAFAQADRGLVVVQPHLWNHIRDEALRR